MEHILALIVATAVLVLLPGPNLALIVASSLAYGRREGVLTVLGTTTGTALQLMLVVLGLGLLLELAADALNTLRWLGVLYLLWLGFRTFREPPAELGNTIARRRLLGRSMLIAVANPKTLLFNAAFLPQFMPAGAAAGTLWLLAAVFLLVIFVGDLLWALFAASARPLFAGFSGAANRIAGGMLCLAALGLALSRRLQQGGSS